MAEVKEFEEKTEIEEIKEEPQKRTIIPEICTYENEDGKGYIIEVILPGVEKDTIKLKMNENYLVVYGETESLNYGGLYQLCCSIDPEKAKSTYKNGLLKIEVPYLDIMKDTVDVKIE
ncbi:MAG: Hsp20/alpha crystallin family protein [Candidatus Hodarchaeota archaeon]